MTGFGSAEVSTEDYQIQVVLRSLNHRHLDIRFHALDALRMAEERWATLIRSRVRRGRIEATVTVDFSEDEGHQVFDREVVQRLANEVESMRASGLVNDGVTAGELLLWPPALKLGQKEFDFESVEELVAQCFEQALDDLVATRKQEGARLTDFLLGRLDRIEEIAEALVGRRSEVEAGLRQDYRERLVDLGAGAALSEERVALEVAAAIDKSSISEETDRLRAHCEHFREVVTSPEAVGRKLDFIVQEMFRELNTVAAKARDSESVHLAIEAKTVCEDLREQLRNVE